MTSSFDWKYTYICHLVASLIKGARAYFTQTHFLSIKFHYFVNMHVKKYIPKEQKNDFHKNLLTRWEK